MISYREQNGMLYVYLHRVDMPGGNVHGIDGDIVLIYPHAVQGKVDVQDAKTIIDRINNLLSKEEKPV